MLERILMASVWGAAVATLWHFLTFWQWNYSSDTVLVGLAAQRFLSHLELPIFVPEVGYQGLLLEVPLTAAVFKIFGVGVHSLNLVPAFFYSLLLVAFYKVARVSFDRLTALIALLFLILSPPQWCGVVLRSIPNYPQTFLSGLCLFLLYIRICEQLLRQPVSENQAADKQTVYFAAAFGLLAGFSFYTYGQIVYFFIGIGLHASLFYFRAEFSSTCDWRRVLFPIQRTGAPLAFWIFKRFAFGFSLLALVSSLIPWGNMKVGPNRLEMLKLLFVAGIAFVAIHLVQAVWRYREQIRFHWKALAAVAMGFIVGYSPKLYYNYILRKYSLQKLSVGGTLSDVWHRVGFLWDGMHEMYLMDPWWIQVFVLLALAGALGFFLRSQYRISVAFVTSQQPVSAYKQVSLFFFLVPGILVPLLSSSSFSDITAIRYALAGLIPIAVALGYAVVSLHRSDLLWKQAIGWGALVLVLCVCVRSYRQGGTCREQVNAFDLIASTLQERGISHAYTEYWYGYSIAFLHPELKVLPLSGNYLKYDVAEVAAASSVALIAPKVSDAQIKGDRVYVGQKKYSLVETLVLAGRQVHVLTALPAD
jgi:4-amino-4-deoxy-L-arabinose transferase-like glycosyltransferase